MTISHKINFTKDKHSLIDLCYSDNVIYLYPNIILNYNFYTQTINIPFL